jgi:hypothetical protein
MRWVAKHVGRKGRDKEKKTKNVSSPVACPGEEEEETMPPQNGTVSSLSLFVFFFKMHGTTSFCPKRSVSFK